tara:strand:- start:1309 stop:1509 length:201 start_codon:yes stop_codon:yes gene_type:complete
MSLRDKLFQKGLKIIDDTIGKDVKVVDQITDIFQDEQVKLLEEFDKRLTKIEKYIERERNENKDAG